MRCHACRGISGSAAHRRPGRGRWPMPDVTRYDRGGMGMAAGSASKPRQGSARRRVRRRARVPPIAWERPFVQVVHPLILEPLRARASTAHLICRSADVPVSGGNRRRWTIADGTRCGVAFGNRRFACHSVIDGLEGGRAWKRLAAHVGRVRPCRLVLSGSIEAFAVDGTADGRAARAVSGHVARRRPGLRGPTQLSCVITRPQLHDDWQHFYAAAHIVPRAATRRS